MDYTDWSEGIMKQWQEAQRQYWQQIPGMVNPAPEGEAGPFSDVAERYREALQKYMDACSGHNMASLQALRQRVEQMGKEGEGYDINSLRELYELWIDVSEEAYSKFAMSKQYQEHYGELVNAFVALKTYLESALEPQLRALNIPTRQDFDSVLQQLEQVKKENAALREQSEQLMQRVSTLEAAAAKQPAAGESEIKKGSEAPPDDLTKIKGIGPKMGGKLIDAGIQTFDNLAALSTEQQQALDEKLGARGRLVRDDWAGQAAKLSETRLA